MWIVPLAAAVLVGSLIAVYVHRELRRAQESDPALAQVAPVRLVLGILLIMAVLLIAVGIAFALPKPGLDSQGRALVLGYWLFIGLLSCAILLLAMFDMAVVRRSLLRHHDKALHKALLEKKERQERIAGNGADPDSKQRATSDECH